MQLKLKYLILTLTILTSFWFWKIFNTDILVALCLLTITILLFTLSMSDKARIVLMIAIGSFSIFILFIIKSNFDTSVFLKTEKEIQILNERRSYYPQVIGAIFQNKVNLILHKYIGNTFANLDPNVYFFAGHPREQGNISDFEKFSPLLIPFFVFGILWNIKTGKQPIFVYSLWTLFISGFSNLNSSLGPVFFFPMICILLSQGLINIITKLGELNK